MAVLMGLMGRVLMVRVPVLVAVLLANLAFSLSARLGNCLADLGHCHRLRQHFKQFVEDILILARPQSTSV